MQIRKGDNITVAIFRICQHCADKDNSGDFFKNINENVIF